MKQSTINHKRLTHIVKSVAGLAESTAREYLQMKRHKPDSEALKVLERELLPGIELADSRVFITVNDEFLERVGYDGNLGGFLADYFGSDAKFTDGEPLKFRYLEGFLVNPTKLGKQSK